VPRRCSRSSAARGLALVAVAVLLGACAAHDRRASEPIAGEPYPSGTVLREAEGFFGRGAKGLADVLNRAFKDHGPPTGYIEGEEGAGSVGIGLRYGHGTLYLQDGTTTEVYWRGPSIGLDVGGSATKTFILVYELPTLDALFERFGGVEGSLFYVGGVGMNYNRHGDTILAPVRFGVGWRQGLNVGYMRLSADKSWLPF
jgi:hypothetical protein